LHPRPTVGFDAHLDLVWLGRRVQVLRDQLMQGCDPGQALRQPTARQHPARLVFYLHVMVGFSPIVANKQHPAPHSVLINKSSNRGEDLLRQAVAVLRDALARRGTRAPGRNGAALAASAQGLAVYLLTPCVDPEELENELGRNRCTPRRAFGGHIAKGVHWDALNWTV
jgi:hypothetical protein